jgi:putative salt-induced outer membrane protein YdiY
MAAQIMFYVRPFLEKTVMKKHIATLLMVTGFLVALTLNASAQTNVIIVTNVMTVTVTVTNYVIVTNQPAKTDAAIAASPIVQPPKYPWESSLGAGLTLTRGNSDTLLVTASIQTDKKTPKNEISLGADGAYGENNSVKNVDTVHGFGQYNHLFTEKFYAYGRVEGLHDGIADLQYRLTVGPGVGYYFLKETNTTFAGEIGSSYVTQRLGDVNDDYITLRLAENFEYKFKRFGARFWEKAEVLPQVDDFNNYILNAEVGIESSITKTVSLKTFLVDNFNNQPAPGREKNDLKLVSGISYKF